MILKPRRRTRPTPFIDPEARLRLREQQLAENRLDTIRSQATPLWRS